MDKWKSYEESSRERRNHALLADLVSLVIFALMIYQPATGYTPILIAFVLWLIYEELWTIWSLAQLWSRKLLDAKEKMEEMSERR